MTIGELSTQSGVPASTIRYWEKIGVLPKPQRASGQRRYAIEAIQRIAVVRLAQSCGFGLEEMRQLFHGFLPGVPASRLWREMAGKKQAELDAHIARLHAMRKLLRHVQECQCVDLFDCGRIAATVMDQFQ